MRDSVNNTGAALTLNPQAVAAVSGAIGKTLCLAIIKDIGLQGAQALDKFVKVDCRAVFAADNDLPTTMGIATMQQLKPAPKGLSTLYTYYLAIRKMAAKGDTAAILAATTASVTKGSGEPRNAKAPKSKPADAVPHPLTVDDAIAFLQAAHKAITLSPLHYAALAALRPAVESHPMRNMGAAVIVEALALAH